MAALGAMERCGGAGGAVVLWCCGAVVVDVLDGCWARKAGGADDEVGWKPVAGCRGLATMGMAHNTGLQAALSSSLVQVCGSKQR